MSIHSYTGKKMQLLTKLLPVLLLLLFLQQSRAQVNYAVPQPAMPNMVKIEYYVDIDPGKGNGIPVIFTPGTDLANLAINIDPTFLQPGLHRIGLRGSDANGAWSLDNVWIFYKPFLNPPPAAPNITYAEYYIDTDPGIGNASTINIVPGTQLENITFPVDPTFLQPGIHRIGLRGRDANGTWSLDNVWVFYKPFLNPPPSAQNITYAEYYIDNDPGFGLATPVPFTPDTNLANLLIPIDPTNLQPGIHRVGVRGRTAAGAWSLDNAWVFYKPFLTAPPAAPNIVYVEYYIDNDPGAGNATTIPVTPGTDLANLTININPAAINTGVHRLGVRGRDANGAWSLDNQWLFYKTASGSGNFANPPQPLPDITAIEYYIDADPGYGRATPVLFTPGTNLANLNINLDTAALSPGMHRLGIRAKDAYNGWGLDNMWLFYRPFAGGNTVSPPSPAPNFVRLEYYIDTDPGFGNGIPVNFNPGSDLSDLIININPANLPLGPHKLGLRGKDANGAWSLDNTLSFTVEPVNGINITLAGNIDSVLCAGDSIYLPYSVNIPLNPGNQFIAQLSNASGSFASPVAIGSVTTQQSGTVATAIPVNTVYGNNYRVRIVASSPVVVSNNSAESLSINRIPSSGFSISGPGTVCLGTQTYTAVNTIPGDSVTYNWQLVSGGTLTPNGSTVTVNWTTGGTHILQLYLSNSCGQSLVKQYLVSVNSGSLSAPTNLQPVNNAVSLNIPVNFSWSAVPNASSYDLFVWPAAGTPPASPTLSGITTINYTYGTGLQYGQTYRWKIRGSLNGCSSAESITQQFTIRSLPDLVISEITVPDSAVTEAPLTFSWKTLNQGTGGTGSDVWYERVYFSLDTQLDIFNDSYIGSYSNLSALGPSLLYQSSAHTYTVPQGLQGPYYIILITDYTNRVLETDNNNNTRVSAAIYIKLAPPPDLQVTALSVTPLTAFSEDSLRINYTVKNMGTGPTIAASWYDRVYLSTSPIYNPNGATLMANWVHYGGLPVNAQYNIQEKIKLPQNIQGEYYIHIVTDFYNQVFEYNSEGNNTATSLPLTIILRPTPNLVINSITAPADTVSAGQNVNVLFTVKNIGALTAQNPWDDEAYLSADTLFNLNQDIRLAGNTQTSPLLPFSSAGKQLPVTMPKYLPEGNYYFFAKTDVYNQVNEFPNENDNLSAYAGPVFIALPDLRLTQFSGPAIAQSEQNILLQYTAGNFGKGRLINGSWADRVYLSPDTLRNGNDVLMGTVGYNRTLQLSEMYSGQLSVTLPQAISGNYYLLLVTDSDNNINESDNNNNLKYIPISISLAPWPDLTISEVTRPATAFAGTNVTIAYTGKNIGAGNIINKQWTDYVFLSPDSTTNNPNNRLVATVQQNRSLAAGSSYTGQAVFVLSQNQAQGRYYIVVVADGGNNIFENTAETNNRTISNGMNIVATPNIDLAVTSGSSTPAAAISGQAVQVIYTVKNTSNNPTLPGNWIDAVYLSANQTFDGGDRLLNAWTVNTQLAPNDTIRFTRTVVIPNDVNGTFYLLVVTDRDNQQNDINRANNVRTMNTASGGGGIVVTLPTPVDLQPIAISAPPEGFAGQPVWVKYTIRNNGPGAKFVPNWRDDVFLSNNPAATSGFSQTGKNFTDTLPAGATYSDSLQVFLDHSLNGNYVAIIRADANDKQYEHNAENNNNASTSIFVRPQQPCDLVVDTITLPASPQLAGRNITINWGLSNRGQNPANGYTREAVYLSKDTLFNAASDILMGTLDGSVSINPQQTIARQLTAPLNNVSLGQYYIIIRSDILNNITEINDTNNTAVSILPFTVDVQPLLLNIPDNDTLFNGRALYRRIHIADSLAGESLRLSLFGDTAKRAVNRLFLRYAQVPAANVYEFVSEIPFQANQQIIVPSLLPGDYYLLALGNDTSALRRQLVTLEARIIPFEITSVNARRGGNTGGVTVKITGGKFNSNTRFSLTSGPAGTIAATTVYYINPSIVFATFNLLGKAPGVYNVVARQVNNDSVRVVNGFQIVTGPGSVTGGGTGFVCQVVNVGYDELVSTDIIRPANIRFSAVQAIIIAYENTSTIDIPMPTRFLVSLTGVPLGFTVDELSQGKTSLPIPFTEAGGPPGILRAGAKGYVRVYTKATLRVPVIEFVLIE